MKCFFRSFVRFSLTLILCSAFGQELRADTSDREFFELVSSELEEVESRNIKILSNPPAEVLVRHFQGGSELFDSDGILVWEYRNEIGEDEVLYRFSSANKVILSLENPEANTAIVEATTAASVDPIPFSTAFVATLEEASAATVVGALDDLLSLSEVLSAGPDWIHFPTRTPSDPQFGSQYGLPLIDAPSAWDQTIGDGDVVVAIIDTGVDYRHSDLATKIFENPGETGLDANGNDKSRNGIDDDNNGLIDDWSGWDFRDDDNDPNDIGGHGTHVAGTVAAQSDNGIGVAGVSWNSKILPIRFLGPAGGSTADAISSVGYARSLGIRITNNSWGGGGFNQQLLDEINTAGRDGSLFIAAAGNNGRNTDISPHFPSSYDSPYIVSVLASDQSDSLASFSNYGEETTDLAAPGVSVLSTHLNDGYRSLSGTSMAAPHVAGVAALVLSKDGHLTPLQVKARLLNGVEKVPSMNEKSVTGGRLNANKALAEIVSIDLPVGAVTPYFGDPAMLPENWIVADGSTVADPNSPYFGKKVPDLRGRFMMGSTDGSIGQTGGQEKTRHGHSVSVRSNSVWFGLQSGNGRKGGHSPANRAGGFNTSLRDLTSDASITNPYETHGHMNGIARSSGNTSSALLDNRPPFITAHYIIRIK